MTEALIVMIGSERCAVPMERVIEVWRYDGATRIPGSPEWVCGIVDRAGTPVEVIDAARRIGVPRTGSGAHPCLLFFTARSRWTAAMLVDDVDRLVAVRRSDSRTALPRAVVLDVLDDDGAAVPLLDVDALFEEEHA
ncbi:MAG TPA: chemotaxis protein CheW [Thermoanaerobaculia bacterium]|nr:chemotaxis protein CheW [Thermoanaerobaculia bacterium]